MYPVTGASGGATRSPLLRMPTMLVSRDPCHNSILQQQLNNTAARVFVTEHAEVAFHHLFAAHWRSFHASGQ